MMTRRMTVPPPGEAPTEPGVGDEPARWRPDAVLEGFECRTLPLTVDPLTGEPEDPLVGTLVRRSDAALRAHPRALLSVHGWNDYFFHPHVAAFFESQGFAFHALDLRRYGRSWSEGQYRGYVDDLGAYADEIDLAVDALREDFDSVVLLGHSTGGLTAALYAADRPGALDGLILNSPWLDMWGPPALTTLLKPLLGQLAKRNPISVLPLPESDARVYARAMHASYGGEWDYDFTLKTPDSEPVRVGWLRAVLQGHARVADGLGIDCPVLVTTSTRTTFLRRYSEEARAADTVLDVNRINAVAWRLGDVVTTARIEGGTHDLALSPPAGRERWFAAMGAWLRGYVPPPSDGSASAADAAEGSPRGDQHGGPVEAHRDQAGAGVGGPLRG